MINKGDELKCTTCGKVAFISISEREIGANEAIWAHDFMQGNGESLRPMQRLACPHCGAQVHSLRVDTLLAHTQPSTDEEQAAELKACPFCSEQGNWDVMAAGPQGDFLAVQCGACGAQGPSADTEIGARQAWNTRHLCTPWPSTK